MTSVSQTINAIPTRYAGCHFRSRLEARWAVFFDSLGVPWTYEPEGYELVPYQQPPSDYYYPESGDLEHLGHYLPDFYLPSLDAWFEVKGTKPTRSELDKTYRLGKLTGKEAYVAWGDIPRNPTHSGHEGDGWYPSDKPRDIEVWGDYDYAWCICPWCDKPGIEFDARGARVCGWEAHGVSSDRHHNGNHPRLLAAYNAARSARFEHGESGAT